jgi:YVTN family beta-propeller protein
MNPGAMAYDSGKGELFVANDGTHNVSVISDASNTVVASIPVWNGPYSMAFDSGKGELFVANWGSSNVSVISVANNTVVASIQGGQSPDGVAYDSGKGEVFVANYNSNNVSVISDTNDSLVASIPVGTNPDAVAYDGKNGEVFVANYNSNNVSVISDATNTVVVPSIAVGSNPDGAAYDSGKGEIFVTNYGGSNSIRAGNVSVISGSNNTVVATIPIGSALAGVGYDSGKGEVFVANSGSNNVSAISDANNTVVDSILVGGGPVGIAFDFANGYVYVSNNGQGTISIITTGSTPSIYSATYTQSGLPTGTNWSVTINSQTLSSTTSRITFNEANGTYTFTVGAVSGYTASPSSGSVTVNGANKTISITFTPSTAATYAVTFSESGLPSGTSWSVSLNGTTKSGTGSIVFTEPNGAYSFSVGAVPGYTPSPSSGTITASGADVSQAITFTALPPGQYSLIFSTTSLPAGVNWSVTVGTTTHTSTGSTISFAEVNGTYSYTVGAVKGYAAAPSSGNVTINGAPKTVSITFLRPSTIANYAVTFTETGLPAGTSWSATLNGSTKSSTTATITFQEPNGSYTFSVGSVSGYTVGPSPGTIKVNGAAVSQPITFTSSSSQGKGNQTTGFLGLPGYDGYLVVGIIVAAVAAGSLILLLRKRSPPRGSDSVEDSKNIADGAASQVAVE